MAYKIKEVSKQTGFSIHTLRYYEKIRLLLKVSRNSAGCREYSQGDINWLLFLKKLKTTGMPLEGMLQYALLKHEGDNTFSQRKELLLNHKEDILQQIQGLKENLNVIDKKIEFYKSKEIRGEKKENLW